MEGLNITFPQTQDILDNVVTAVKSTDVMFVLNMRDAWQFILKTLDEQLNIMYLREVNKICGRGLIYGCGDLRMTDVRITGASTFQQHLFMLM